MMRLLFALLLTGCGTTAYYKTVATTAAAVGAGYRALDHADVERIAGVKGKALEDKHGAQDDLNAWMAVYDKARLALDVAEDLIEKCMPEPSIPGCAAGLVAAGADVAKALGAAGVK